MVIFDDERCRDPSGLRCWALSTGARLLSLIRYRGSGGLWAIGNDKSSNICSFDLGHHVIKLKKDDEVVQQLWSTARYRALVCLVGSMAQTSRARSEGQALWKTCKLLEGE